MQDADLGYDVLLTTPTERAILAAGLELLLRADEALGMFAQDSLPCAQRRFIVELQERVQPEQPQPLSPTANGLLLEDLRARTSPHGDPLRDSETPGVTRPQELAGDAMAALYGRSAVERQADGSAIIRGLLDDVEMESVCVEPDGRERWRRR